MSLHPYVRAALDEIKATPHDDAPRLMLADWLEENGTTECERARGTLLRLGCRAAARPHWDAHRFLEQRQLWELLRRHRDDWLAGLPVERFRIQRGLFHVQVEATDVDFLPRLAGAANLLPWIGCLRLDVARLAAEPPRNLCSALAVIVAEVRQLFVTGCRPDLPWLALLDQCDTRRVVALTLAGGIEEGEFRSLLTRPFDSLQELDIPTLGGTWFRNWPVLHRLRVLRAGGQHHSRRVRRWGAWPALEELSCDDPESWSFDRVGDWPRLRQVRVAGWGAPGSLRALLRSALLGHLEALEISGDELTPAETTALVHSGAAHLRRLVLPSRPVTPAAATTLFEKPNLPALRELSVPHAQFDEQAASALVASPLLGQLESLDLACGALDNASAIRLGAVPELWRLRHLGLGHCSWWPPLLRELLGHKEPARLCHLDLAGSSYSTESLLMALMPERLPELIGLNLYRATPWPEDIRALVGSPYLRSLRVLDLTEARLSEAEHRALFAATHLAEAGWVRITRANFPPDLVAAWRDRFGYDSVVERQPLEHPLLGLIS